jgi:SAM-dependent methyltransferase
MTGVLTPRRHRGAEILDDPRTPPRVRLRSLGDVARANALFGGARAALSELRRALANADGDRLTMLDVGTGAGDIVAAACDLARARGVTLEPIALDLSRELLVPARARTGLAPVCGDAMRLPFADASVDVVLCSQLLHHFEGEPLLRALAELDRVARHRVIVADLRRSWAAAAGLWLASFPLLFHPVSRHDGVVSVLRGFTPDELLDHVHRATGTVATVRRHPGFRVTASWTPASARAEAA